MYIGHKFGRSSLGKGKKWVLMISIFMIKWLLKCGCLTFVHLQVLLAVHLLGDLFQVLNLAPDLVKTFQKASPHKTKRHWRNYISYFSAPQVHTFNGTRRETSCFQLNISFQMLQSQSLYLNYNNTHHLIGIARSLCAI